MVLRNQSAHKLKLKRKGYLYYIYIKPSNNQYAKRPYIYSLWIVTRKDQLKV